MAPASLRLGLWCLVLLVAGAAKPALFLRPRTARIGARKLSNGWRPVTFRPTGAKVRSYEEVLGRNPMNPEQGESSDSVEMIPSFEQEEEEAGDERLSVDDPTIDGAEGPFVVRFDDAQGEEVVLLLMKDGHTEGCDQLAKIERSAKGATCIEHEHKIQTLLNPSRYFREIQQNRRQLEVWLPSFRTAYKSVEETRDILNQEIEWMHRAKSIRWSVLVNGMVKGNVGLNLIDWKGKVGYLGYWLSSDVQGRGIMSRAVQEVCRIGFEVLDLDHMDISARKKNDKSAAVAKRLGFIKQTEIEDNEPGVKFPLDVYTLSRSDRATEKRVTVAREEFYLLNAMGYLSRQDPISFSLQSRKLDGSDGIFQNLFRGWG
eukprot:jgi/Bigna1/91307/estExt_fgenesh1_pg.C_960027